MNANSELQSAFSSENALNRLISARAQATKEANRMFIASLIFSGLFLIKLSGLRIDLTLLDTKVADVPYGLFFFLLSSQVCAILCCMRSGDSAALDSKIRAEIENSGSTDVAYHLRSLVNDFDWFAITSSEFNQKSPGIFANLVYNVTSLLTAITALILYAIPLGSGIYTLWKHNSLIVGGNVDLQYWVLFTSTFMTACWFLSYIAIWAVMRR